MIFFSKNAVLFLSISMFSIFNITAQQQWGQIGSDIIGKYADDASGYSVSVSADSLIIAVGSPESSEQGYVSGQVRVFKFVSGKWVQMGHDINARNVNDRFGISVSLSADGMTLAASSRKGNGYVMVYHFNGTDWMKIGDVIRGEASGDSFGHSINISSDGTALAIGAPYADSVLVDVGAVYVFRYDQEDWVQQGETVYGQIENEKFGGTLQLSGDGLSFVAGDSYRTTEPTNFRQVRVYTFEINHWVQLGGTIDGIVDDFDIGKSLSISSDGNTVAVKGHYGLNNSNEATGVRVYKHAENEWLQIGDELYFYKQGSISLSGDGSRIAISYFTYDNADSYGSVITIYNYDNDSWKQVGNTITENEWGWFGNATSLNSDGSIVLIGGPYVKKKGLVRAYNLCESSLTVDTHVACSSFTWINGKTYTDSNDSATVVYTNTGGCDSVIRLDLTIGNSNSIDYRTTCDSLVWIDGETYTESNYSATHTFTTAHGCDSVVSLSLTKVDIDTAVFYDSDFNELANYTQSADFQWLDCDDNNSIVSGETDQLLRSEKSGNYALRISKDGCIKTTSCFNNYALGILENDFGTDLSIFPVPTEGAVTIDLGNSNSNFEVQVCQPDGKLLDYFVSENNVARFDIKGGRGYYILRISAPDGKRASVGIVKK